MIKRGAIWFTRQAMIAAILAVLLYGSAVVASGVGGGGLVSRVLGTTTNDAASAGYVGELIEGVRAQASAVGVGGAGVDITSVTLTAGDWDVGANVAFLGAPVGGTRFAIGVGTTSAAVPATAAQGNTTHGTSVAPTASAESSLAIVPFRVSLAATTTYYLTAVANFSSGSTTAAGRLSARRVR